MKLNISDTIKLPLNAVTEKLAFLGRTGSGKSYAATKLAEEMRAAEAQVVAIDPVGIWYGLRSAADRTSPGLSIPVFGGLHGDVPLEPTGGALIADLIVDKTLSCIIDVSQFEHDTDKARFAADFAKRLFFRKKSSPSAMHLFLEEAEEFLPQDPERGEERMIHEFKRIWKLGRNFGIGGSLISQRPQEILKKALNLTECLFAFQMTGPHERKAIDVWISEKGLDQDIAADLPKLEVGQCHLWSPAWLKVSETIRISAKWTFDASSTPTVGKARKEMKMAEIDLAAIAHQMKATIEKAKENDPAELKREIARLRKEINAKAQSSQGAKIETKTEIKKVEVPALTVAERKRLAALIESYERMETVCSSIDNMATEIKQAAFTSRAEVTFFKTLLAAKLLPDAPAQRAAAGGTRPRPEVRRSQTAATVSGHGTNGSEVSGGLKRMMIALAQRPGLNKRQIGVRAGLSSTSGTFGTYMGKLRSNGWIDGNGEFSLTDDGVTALGSYQPLPEGEDLLNYWLNALGDSGARRMLRALADIYPNAFTKDELGAQANISSTSGTFGTYLGKLRTLELIEGRGDLRAAKEFFE